MYSFMMGDGFAMIFFLMFFLIFGLIVVQIIRGISQWNKNNHSPRLTVDAIVVTKRIDVSYDHHNGSDMHTSSHTSYYVTFQVESGDRIEFCVRGDEYGMLVEGDKGRLTFQGTRYLGFE